MKKTFNQYEVINRQPKKLGWYNTDKGLLYWWGEPFVWSCRDDKISCEYPKYWYEEENILTPILFYDWAINISDSDLQHWDGNGCPIRRKTTVELYTEYLHLGLKTQAGGV